VIMTSSLGASTLMVKAQVHSLNQANLKKGKIQKRAKRGPKKANTKIQIKILKIFKTHFKTFKKLKTFQNYSSTN